MSVSRLISYLSRRCSGVAAHVSRQCSNCFSPFVDLFSYSGIIANHHAFGLNRPGLDNEKNHSRSCGVFLDFACER